MGQGAGQQDAWGWGLAPAVGFPELTQDHPHHLILPWPYLGTDVRDPPDGPFAQGAPASQSASLDHLWERLGLTSLSCPGCSQTLMPQPCPGACPQQQPLSSGSILPDSAKLLETQSHP